MTETKKAIGAYHWGKGDFGIAWVFVWMARANGWDVSDPIDNEFGYPLVRIYSKPEGVE